MTNKQFILPGIDPKSENRKITNFIKRTLSDQKREKVVIGLSGGIDSTLSFFLVRGVLPLNKIIVAHLYYGSPDFKKMNKILHDLKFPKKNIHMISIKKAVDITCKMLNITDSSDNKIRKGNICARMRMIALFDLAKLNKALVIGTENKSENLLGYFTRFGDQASDIEPIEHLYKTQVLDLAKYLGIPDDVINQPPSAGLWENQTDEKELGFSYEEADKVLYLYIDKKMRLDRIKKFGLKNAEKIISRYINNKFKHEAPYLL